MYGWQEMARVRRTPPPVPVSNPPERGLEAKPKKEMPEDVRFSVSVGVGKCRVAPCIVNKAEITNLRDLPFRVEGQVEISVVFDLQGREVDVRDYARKEPLIEEEMARYGGLRAEADRLSDIIRHAIQEAMLKEGRQ